MVLGEMDVARLCAYRPSRTGHHFGQLCSFARRRFYSFAKLTPILAYLVQLCLSNLVRQCSTLLLVNLLQAEFPHLAKGSLLSVSSSGRQIFTARQWTTTIGHNFKNVKLDNIRWADFQ